MSYGKPFWVYEREASLREMYHQSELGRLQHRIRELEKKNSDLTKKIEKMESAFLIAIDLLMKKS